MKRLKRRQQWIREITPRERARALLRDQPVIKHNTLWCPLHPHQTLDPIEEVTSCEPFRELISTPPPEQAGSSSLVNRDHPSAERFVVELSQDGALTVSDVEYQRTLVKLPADTPWLSARYGEEELIESRGFFHLRAPQRQRGVSHVWRAGPPDQWERLGVGELRISGALQPVDSAGLTVTQALRWEIALVAAPTDLTERALQLRVTWSAPDPDSSQPEFVYRPNRLTLHLSAEPDEQIFGMGAQLTVFNLKGRAVPSLVQEPGIGRGVQPLTWMMERAFGAGGSEVQSSAPSPVYLTDRGETHALEESEYALFDFTRPDLRLIEIWAPHLTLRVFGGAPEPIERLRALTAFTGRMSPLPAWVHRGAIIGAQGGTEATRSLWTKLRDADVAVSAMWLQDWVGKRETSVGEQLWWDWSLDRAHYPEWEALVADLDADQVKTLGYINPYLVNTSERVADASETSPSQDLFSEAAESGYLVADPQEPSRPLMGQNTSFSAAIVDLTNPDAYAWLKGVIKERLINVGLSGWMADFGEALPMDAPLERGEASTVHNLYPVLWAQLNAEAIAETGRAEELLFFTRAGYLKTPQHSRLTWLGDQLTSWRREDGIYSALVGLLSSGMSGVSISHSDAGGYICTAPPRTPLKVPLFTFIRSRELLMRWVEMNAFTAVLRTHEGNQPSRHHQIDDDPQTLRHFARLSRVYRDLAPVRRSLEEEASLRGTPLVAHPWLYYSDDPETLTLQTQFMLGPDLMIAPVLHRGRRAVTLYLPRGSWRHWWSGEVVSGPCWIEVSAPLGSPAVFACVGSESDRVAQESAAREGATQDADTRA